MCIFVVPEMLIKCLCGSDGHGVVLSQSSMAGLRQHVPAVLSCPPSFWVFSVPASHGCFRRHRMHRPIHIERELIYRSLSLDSRGLTPTSLDSPVGEFIED